MISSRARLAQVSTCPRRRRVRGSHAKYPGLPLPADLLGPSLWVAEIVYFPLRTELLIEAEKVGCRILDGGGMAVFQAVGAFELFTGLQPDADRMLRHFAEMTRGADQPVRAAGGGR